jgi:hypothetical protein
MLRGGIYTVLVRALGPGLRSRPGGSWSRCDERWRAGDAVTSIEEKKEMPDDEGTKPLT